MTISLSQKTKITTFTRTVSLAIPPENPQITGSIDVEYRIKSKPDVEALKERALSDAEYIHEIVANVHGMGDENDQPITGAAAIEAVLNGQLSMYLVPAIVSEYFAQFGEARVVALKKPR